MMSLTNIIPDLFYGLIGFGILLIWNLILFNIGTLLQKNKDVANYFNIKLNDTMNHLIDSSPNSSFNPSLLIATIGSLLKFYALGDIVFNFLKLGRYIF